jgi:hypothetical protein
MIEGYHSTLELVDPARLQIDKRVQGTLWPGRVKKIAEEFDPAAVGEITVSQRKNGTQWVMDGQHRVAAAKLAGYTDKMAARVFTGLSLADEARLFVLKNNTKLPALVDRLFVAAEAGDDVALQVRKILDKHGWGLKDKHRVSAAGAIQSLAKLDVDEIHGVLDRTMTIITAAFDYAPESTNKIIVLGLGQVINKYPLTFRDPRAISVLVRLTPGEVLDHVATLRPAYGPTGAFSSWLIRQYNLGLSARNKLPSWE